MIRLYLVEDHPAVARGLVEVLGAMAGMEVVGSAVSVEGALPEICRQEPDVVVCDVMFGDAPKGFELPQELARSGMHVPVLFYSSHDLPWFLTHALEVGAAGYVLKTESEAHLRDAIVQVARGRPAVPMEALPGANKRKPPSPREAEIIALTGAGLSNGEMASRLAISQKTVESHIARLFMRYNVRNRTELVTLALAQGWLRMDSAGVLRSMR